MNRAIGRENLSANTNTKTVGFSLRSVTKSSSLPDDSPATTATLNFSTSFPSPGPETTSAHTGEELSTIAITSATNRRMTGLLKSRWGQAVSQHLDSVAAGGWSA